MFKVGKYYYLMAAESGTYYMHSEVIFRSKSPKGPFEECPHNPILTQRDLGLNNRLETVTSTGHASLVQAADGKWWAAFLGCRPYENDTYNTGRETFLLPVTWKDGWPTILEHGKAVPTVVDKPGLKPIDNNYITGNFNFTDRFDTDRLDFRWIFLRNPHMENYDWSGKGISLKPQPINIYELASPTALFYRQKHTSFSAETVVNFQPKNDHELAGITLFQNDRHNFVMGKTIVNEKPALTLTRTEKDQTLTIGTVTLSDTEEQMPLRLRVDADGKYYSFFYAAGNGEWKTLAQGVDATNLSSAVGGGFVGTTIGLYATTKKDK
jgi:alpha-N-arabinofuranosidase